MFHVEIDTTALERGWMEACRALSAGCQRGVKLGVEEGAAIARQTHGYKDRTGELTKSIGARVITSTQGGAVGEITARAKYASFVEGGTAAHVIRPKAEGNFQGPVRRGQSRRGEKDIGTTRVALRWVDGGTTHFARLVHHPGAAAHPFMGQAVQKAERVIVREVEIAQVKAAAIMDAL